MPFGRLHRRYCLDYILRIRITIEGDIMAEIPKNVLDLLRRPDSVKVLVTASEKGVPHAIVCGSIISPEPSKVAVGEILMKVSAKNMAANPKVSILVTKGPEAYIIKAAVGGRVADGGMLDDFNRNLEKMNLRAAAVWVFDVLEVFDEGAGPNAGRKLA